MSFGRQSPVVIPSGVLVEIHPYSSRISAPVRVDEMRPMTKKHVLYRIRSNIEYSVRTHPFMVKTGEWLAMSMITSMISSSSRNGNPPSVEPILPCFAVNTLLHPQSPGIFTHKSPEDTPDIGHHSLVSCLHTVKANNLGKLRHETPLSQ